MIAYLFYTKDSPGEDEMQRLAEELRRSQVDSELVEADSPHGIALSENYDVVVRPAVVLAGVRAAPPRLPIALIQRRLPNTPSMRLGT